MWEDVAAVNTWSHSLIVQPGNRNIFFLLVLSPTSLFLRCDIHQTLENYLPIRLYSSPQSTLMTAVISALSSSPVLGPLYWFRVTKHLICDPVPGFLSSPPLVATLKGYYVHIRPPRERVPPLLMSLLEAIIILQFVNHQSVLTRCCLIDSLNVVEPLSHLLPDNHHN